MKAPISECPHCGNSEGYFIKVYLTGRSQTRYTWNGEYDDNSDMYDSLQDRASKYAYCTNCEKRLFKMEVSHSTFYT